MKKITFIYLILVFLVLFSACQPQVSPTTEVPPVKDTPVIKATDTPMQPTKVILPTEDPSIIKAGNLSKGAILDPALATETTVLDVCAQIYQGLVSADAQGNLGPGLAETWSISDDELDVVFTLRRNAVFSDGTPINADVIVENFYRWFDPQHPLHGTGIFQGWKDNFLGFLGELDDDGKPIAIVDGLEKVDDYTVLLHLNRRDPDVLNKLSMPYFAILSPGALQNTNYGSSADTVVTNGPYRIAIWSDTELLLEPDVDYWGEQPDQKMKFDLQ